MKIKMKMKMKKTIREIEGEILELSHELNGILLNYVNHNDFIMDGRDYYKITRISHRLITLIDLMDYKKIFE